MAARLALRFPTLFKFLLFFFVFCILYFVFFSHTAHAQTTTNNNSTVASQSAQVNQYLAQFPPQSPQYANIMTINLIHTISCMAEGSSIIGQPCIEYRPANSGNGVSLVPVEEQLASSGGAVGALGGFLTSMYDTPPLRTAEYIGYAKSNLGIIQPAYAQVPGSGNNVLSPIFKVWELSRNLAYLGMIFIFLVIGFMIMFRQKINSQTVLGVQQAIPGLVVGLLLITFSYFIAALLVDTSFVATHLAGRVLESQIMKSAVPGSTDPNTPKTDPMDDLLNNKSLLAIFNYFIDDSPENLFFGVRNPKNFGPTKAIGETQAVVGTLYRDSTINDILNKAFFIGGCIVGKQIGVGTNAAQALIPIAVGGVTSLITTPVGGALAAGATAGLLSLAGSAADCAGGGLVAQLVLNAGNGALIQTAAGLLVYVILMIALLISMFKLLFALISCYLSIMVSSMFAPLQFLLGSIPGRSGAFGNWLKSMIANLLAFPAVFAAFIFAAFILNYNTDPFYISGGGAGDFSGGTLPLLGGLSSDFLKLALAYGILLITPNIPQMVKEAFGVKGPNFGQAAIGAVTGGFNVGRSIAMRGFRAPIERRRIARQAQMEAEVYNDDRHPFPTQPRDVLSLPREGLQRIAPGVGNLIGSTPARNRYNRYQREMNEYQTVQRHPIMFNNAGNPLAPGTPAENVTAQEFNQRVQRATAAGHPGVPTPIPVPRDWRGRRW